MALAFLLVGLVLVDVAFRGTEGLLGQQLAQDVPGFMVWAGAIVLIGALQWVPGFSKPAKYLLALVLIVIVLVNKGAFANLAAAVTSQPQPVTVPAEPSLAGTPEIILQQQSGSGAGSTAGSVVGGIAQAVPLIGGLL